MVPILTPPGLQSSASLGGQKSIYSLVSTIFLEAFPGNDGKMMGKCILFGNWRWFNLKFDQATSTSWWPPTSRPKLSGSCRQKWGWITRSDSPSSAYPYLIYPIYILLWWFWCHNHFKKVSLEGDYTSHGGVTIFQVARLGFSRRLLGRSWAETVVAAREIFQKMALNRGFMTIH